MNVIKTFDNKSATDLSEKDGYVAKYDSGANICSAITDRAIGVIAKGGASGGQSDIVIFGEANAVLGGTVKRGQHITPHTDSTVVVSAGAGCSEFGMCLEDGVAGDIVPVFVFGSIVKHA